MGLEPHRSAGGSHELNHLNFGGYLMWATGQKTFIDGRLEVVREKFYAEYERYFSPRQDKRQWRQALEQGVTRWNIQWIIFPYDVNPGLLNLLSRNSAWRLAYVDHKAVIFVRNGPEIERYIDPNLKRLLKPSIPSPLRTLPGLFGNQRPNSFKRFLSGFFEKQAFPTHHHMFGLFHYFRREWPKAHAHFTEAVKESRGYYYETYNNLGSASFRLGQLDVARQCYEIVLKEDPKNPIALRRLRQISKMN
ncbi:MAG: tetratricopeptide repeat protein [Deltaproteobacteria bacterium]|nr:tetratricopeptide repeat protein [Deltaproteobacteria bacterium]